MMSKSLQSFILMSQFLMILALEMTNPFLSLLIASQKGALASNIVFYSMLSLVLPMLANIVMTPIWGFAADRYGYKSMLMRAAWALVFTQFAMIWVNSLSGILIIRTLQGAFAGFIVAMQTYSLSLCEWQHKGRQLSRLQSAKAIATTFAGLTGGLILSVSNYQGLYCWALVICLLTTLAMHYYLPAQNKSLVKTNTKLTHPLPRTTSIYFICFLICLTQIIKFLPDPGLSLFINEYFSANLFLIGFIYSLPAIGMLFSSEWCGRQFDRCRTDVALSLRYLASYSLLGLVIMICQALTHHLILFACFRLLWGIVLAALLPALFALLSDRYSLPGYALGLANSCAKLGNLIGLVLGGILMNWLSYPMLFMVLAGLYGLFSFTLVYFHWISLKRSSLFTDYSEVRS